VLEEMSVRRGKVGKDDTADFEQMKAIAVKNVCK
jgi:hypothetical protein